MHTHPLIPLVLLASTVTLTGCAATPPAGPAPQSASAPTSEAPSPPIASATPEATKPTGTPAAAPPSPSATPSAEASQESYQDGWQGFLLAMQSGEIARVKARTTNAGFGSLMKRVGSNDPAVTFKRWGKGWAARDIRWRETSDSTARAGLGPKIKEAGVRLVRDGATWKLDRWTPGD